MKITPGSSVSIEPTPARSEPASGKTVTDRVSVGSAGQIQDAQATAESARAARIQQIAGQVQSGTYKVDPGKVAQAVVDSDAFDRQIQSAVQGS